MTYSDEEVRGGLVLEDTSERDEIVARRLDGLGIEEPKLALEELLAWLQDPRRALPVIPEHPIFQPPDDDEPLGGDVLGAVLEPLPQGRLYLLDEPEQRLHPRLQRHAARWLRTLMSQWGAQCVLATHAVAFMAMGGDTTAYEISRTGDQAQVLVLDPTALTPYSQLAAEMGLDRGELLSRARAFLVTTRPVAALLGEFHAARLAAGQITVLPIEDERNVSDFLSAALVTRVTAAPLAVLLTSTTAQEVRELRDVDAEQRAHAAAQGSEAAAAVALIDDSIRHGHHVELFTLDVASVLDLFDETTIARIAAGSEPFPVHRTAHDRRSETNQTYPQFLSATDGITISDDRLRAVARGMRDAGIPAPAVLTDVVWRLEQLALTSESSPPQSA